MAIVKVKFAKHSERLLHYVLENRGPGDIIDGIGCTPDHAASDFRSVAEFYGDKGTIQAVHVIQSWGETESNNTLPEELNRIGKGLAERSFPGHDFLVVTHTETGRTHNHIVICPWHTETGKKITNKFEHLHNLRRESDQLCREHGLSVLDSKAKDRAAKMPFSSTANLGSLIFVRRLILPEPILLPTMNM